MMIDRLKSSVLIICGLALMLLVRFFWEYSFDLFWLLITVLATSEVADVVNKSRENSNKMISLAYPLLFAIILLGGYMLKFSFYSILIAEILLFILLILCQIFIPMLGRNYRTQEIEQRKELSNSFFNKALFTSRVMLYPALILCSMIFLNHMVDFSLVDVEADNYMFGMFAIIYVIAVSAFTDTMAMFGGMLLKGKKLCPRISYNKTISGFICGTIFGIVASICVYFIFNSISSMNLVFISKGLAWWHFIFIGLGASIATAFGDLLASYIKRRCFVKDFGNFFPGHGGFMDRLNGVMINALFVLILFTIIF